MLVSETLYAKFKELIIDEEVLLGLVRPLPNERNFVSE